MAYITTWQVRVAGGMVWKARLIPETYSDRKHDQKPTKCSWGRETGPLISGNLGWWNIIIWPDHFRFSASHQGWLLSLIANQVYKEDSNQGFNRPACLQILLVVPSLQQGILLNHLLLLGIFPANLTRCLMGESWRGGVEKIHETLVVLSLSVWTTKSLQKECI